MNKDKKKEINPKRAELIALSGQALELREFKVKHAETSAEATFWATRTINYILLNHIYETGGATEFNTFNQWKEMGATIIKGAKSYCIWGQPIRAERRGEGEPEPQPAEAESEADKYKYFPLCHLFSNLQVRFSEDSRAEVKEEPQAKEEFETVNDDDLI